MTKEMVISSAPHETRVAILEDDQVVEVFIEREHSRGVVGNIYKGRVSKVLPGMQSAFVNLGLERDAFLYVTDVISPSEAELEDEDDEPVIPPTPVVEDGDIAAAPAEGEAPKLSQNPAQQAQQTQQVQEAEQQVQQQVQRQGGRIASLSPSRSIRPTRPWMRRRQKNRRLWNG